MKRRGASLVEVLVTLIVIGLVMSMLLQAFISLWKSQNAAVGMSSTQQRAQQIVTTVSNAFRSAVQCTSTDTGCIVNSTIEAPTASSCTVYSRNSSNTLVETTYSLSGANFQNQIGTGTPVTVYSNVSTFALTYYSSTTYYSNALTAYTPTSSTDQDLVAVKIDVTVTMNGQAASYETIVRIRNHP